MDNPEKIKNSLKVIPKVFAEFEDYRILGSLLVAAINGKSHRDLHDIDLLIDKRIYQEVSDRFKELGFKKVTKKAPGFEWDEYEKENHLTFGILLKGNFGNEYFEYKPNEYLSLQINNEYLKPTEYELYGIKIRGIPLRSVYEGIKIANLNKKRGVDKQILLSKTGKQLPSGLSLNQAFNVEVLGVDIPYFYTFFSQIYNLIGGARLMFGRSYDPWN